MKAYLKSKAFLRSFLLFLLLFLLFLSAFFGGLYLVTRNAEQRKQEELFLENAEKTRVLLDGVLDVTPSITYYLGNTSWVDKLKSESGVFDKEFDYSKRKDLENQLLFFSSVYAPVSHIGVVYPYQDFAVTSHGWFSYEDYLWYLERAFQLEKGGFEQTLEARRQSKEAFRHNLQNVSEGYYVSIQKLEHSARPRAMAVIVLRKEGLLQAMAALLPQELCSVEVLGSLEESPLLTYRTGQPAVPFCVEAHSGVMDVTYRLTYDLAGTEPARAPFILFAVPCLLLGIAASFALAVFSYKPIKRILRHLPQEGQENEEEYGMIENALGSLLRQNRGMKEKIALYAEEVQERLLIKLLQGCFAGEGMQEQLERFDLPYTQQTWFSVWLVTLGKKEAGRVLPIIQTYFLQMDEACKCVAVEKGLVAVLFTRQEDFSLPEELAETAEEDLARQLTGCRLTCGAASPGLLGASRSYQEAKAATGAVCTLYYLPEDWNAQLSIQIVEGNWSAAASILREIYRENQAKNALLTGTDGLLTALLKTVEAAAGQLGCPWDAAPVLEYEDEFARQALDDYIERVCVYSLESRSREISNLKQEILQYVDFHFCNPSLSLKDLGERFSLSVTAASKTFKEVAGQNFYEYVTGKRMEKAKYLLDTVSYNTAYISRAVGYENEYSFKRAFLRYTGQKPREYAGRGGGETRLSGHSVTEEAER